MTTSVANIHGSNITRLTVEQFGSNESTCVLTEELLTDSNKWDVTVESLFISSDVPIFPAGTKVFDIISTLNKVGGNAVVSPDGTEIVESCIIGPVYNWADFAFQISQFFRESGVDTIHLDGSMITKKNLSFKGTAAFWDDQILLFTDTFARIFELGTFPVIWARMTAGGDIVSSNTPDVEMLATANTYTAVVTYDFQGNQSLTVKSVGRMDAFENRHRIRIDSVLPLPHEMFCVGSKYGNTETSNRYSFMEFDFPKETVFTKLNIENSVISDNKTISQILHTGAFRLVKPSPHSGLKKMLIGQTQDQRYEIFIVRKYIMADGSVKYTPEKWPMSDGDFFRLVLLFSQEV